VLRLVKPSMIGPLALTCDAPRDLVGDLWEKELETDVTAAKGIEALSLGQFLRLPQGFGYVLLFTYTKIAISIKAILHF